MAAALEALKLDPQTYRNVKSWLEGDYDQTTRDEIRRLMEEDPQKLVDAFYTTLKFGTGGLRGVMGVGTNRINRYTIGAATQGLANYLNRAKPGGRNRAAISYDSRHHSQEFALEAARVLAANEIEVYLFSQLRPTPMASFACRYFGCQTAIMITASHNPPEYNGYKVYWEDGAQVLPPHDEGIIQEVRRVQQEGGTLTAPKDHPLIHWVGEELDQPYLAALQDLQTLPQQNRDHGSKLELLYTSLHGTGITLVPQALASWGFSRVTSVKAQEKPDGDFPTTPSPNPEEREALQLGLEQLIQDKADLLLATDPDADRVGIAIQEGSSARLFTGNEVACLCLAHLCDNLDRQGRLPGRAAFVKTIVTSELFKTIAESYGKTCVDVLPGFKYVAEQIRNWEEEPTGLDFVFGGEESYGYLLGTCVRDKDAISACALVAEMALDAKLNGKTLLDRLHDLYRKYGVYREALESLKFPETKQGAEAISKAMEQLRKSPPSQLAGVPVKVLEDYLQKTRLDLSSGTHSPLSLPKSNVLLFWMADGSKLVIRPSGTEPKVKLYGGVTQECTGDPKPVIVQCENRLADLMNAARETLNAFKSF